MKNAYLYLAGLLLLAMPLSAQAGTHRSGDPCTQAEIGVTEMDADQTGIIGCFRTSAGVNDWKWKFTGGSGFGQCYTFVVQFDASVLRSGNPPESGFSVSQIEGQAVNVWSVLSAPRLYWNAALTTLDESNQSTTAMPYDVRCAAGYMRMACLQGSYLPATLYAPGSENGCQAVSSAGPIGGTSSIGAVTLICCKT